MSVYVRVDAGAATTKLGRVKQMQGVKRGLMKAGLHLKATIATYPPQRRGKQLFVSDRQRRGFFAKLKRGEIQVPYARGISPGSEALGRRWTQEAKAGGFIVEIGNNASYAPLVHDSRRQTIYHRVTGWRTDENVLDTELNEVYRIVNAEVAAELER